MAEAGGEEVSTTLALCPDTWLMVGMSRSNQVRAVEQEDTTAESLGLFAANSRLSPVSSHSREGASNPQPALGSAGGVRQPGGTGWRITHTPRVCFLDLLSLISVNG